MRIKNQSNHEFDVWCRECERVITVEKPEDIRKEIIRGEKRPTFCLICPGCKKEIKFDGIVGIALRPEFVEKVKFKGE